MRLRLIALCVLTILVCGGLSSTVGVQAEPATLAKRLHVAKNEQYLAARDTALALDPAECVALLKHLRADPDDWLALLVAEMLDCRRKNPELAAEFDRLRDETLAHPIPVIKGGPGYRPTLPEESNRADILVFESVFKVDSPAPLKYGYIRLIGKDGRRPKEAVTPLLQLLEVKDDRMWRPAAVTLGGIASDYPDDRILPALVQLYRNVRREELRTGQGYFGDAQVVCWAIRRITNEHGLRCATAVIEFEQTLATDHGFTPWSLDKDAARLEFREAQEAIFRIRVAKARRDDREDDPALKELFERCDELKQQLAWRHIWDQALGAMQTIASAIQEREASVPPAADHRKEDGEVERP